MEGEAKYSNKIFTIPNLLSFFRLLLIPVMWVLYVEWHEPLWTIAVVVLSGLTDVVDGKIARNFHMTSNLGKILDPIADKLTQLALLAILLVQHEELVYVLALQILKEIGMVISGLVVIKKTRVINGAIWPGKVCTVILYATLLLLFLVPEMPAGAVWTLVLLCMVAIVGSFLLYMRHYRNLIRGLKQDEEGA